MHTATASNMSITLSFLMSRARYGMPIPLYETILRNTLHSEIKHEAYDGLFIYGTPDTGGCCATHRYVNFR